ncbi:MAG TPA: chemotaxis protein CheD [Verrucomicrobiae bacterium]
MPPLTQWVIAPPKKTLVVGVADMVASNDPGAEIVTYSLGSCLGITLYDPVRKIGGLLHVMLPDSSIDAAKAVSAPHMFVDTGVPRLFQAVASLGGDRSRAIIRVAGGSQFLDQNRVFNIGQRNCDTLFALLARNGYTVHAQDIGGIRCRTMRFDLSTGEVSIHSPGVTPYRL